LFNSTFLERQLKGLNRSRGSGLFTQDIVLFQKQIVAAVQRHVWALF